MGFFCAVPFVARLLACPATSTLGVGYVEGDYVQLAPVSTAELVEVSVRQGDRVAVGQIVARQDATDAEIALAQTEAQRDQAAADLANLREGSRPEEIAVTEASLSAAEARLREAQRQADRQVRLATSGVVSQANLDSAIAARDTATSDVAQLEAQLAVQRLPARAQVVAAAEGRLRGTDAAVRDAAWALEKRAITSPVDGAVNDVLRRVGEIAGPTTPVLSILPDGAWKVVAFIPETALSGITPGDRLAVRCDGCPDGLTATISYVAQEPEFTPPVIYSLENRQKLVYRVEARPDADQTPLRPGQIVDVAHAE